MEESVRIVVLDFYLSPPIPGLDVTYSEFRSASINQVPILRCFGSTKSGKKICVHIHGVFPYLYIPYDGVGKAESLMYQLSASIDKAVNISLNQGSSSTQHVYKISLVSGIPMYGYHPKKHQFFKIYLYNPMLVSTVTNLLLNHSILDKVFQPHEAHINFTLQFMIDYNLHGMSNMIISSMKYRVDLNNPNTNIDKDLFLPPNIEKITVCELEVDINAENIVNRREITSGNLTVNPGIAALWADEQQRRRNKNEESQLGQFLELKNMKFKPTKTHQIFQQALVERLAVLSTNADVSQSPNISVYPAETPNNSNIQNASLIDIHMPSSLELSLSLDDTINVSNSQNLDETIMPTQGHLNMTMDEDANNFLQLLQQLAEEKAMENAKEEDSILSQTMKGNEPNDDSHEDFLDLSMPLAAVTTPTKANTKIMSEKNDGEDDYYFDTTLIPQVDGQTEQSDSSDDEPIAYRTRSKTLMRYSNAKQSDLRSCKNLTVSHKDEKALERPSCGKSMPLLDMDLVPSVPTLKVSLDIFNMIPAVNLHPIKPIAKIGRYKMPDRFNISDNNLRRNQYVQKYPEKKIDEHMRLIRFRINRINRKSELKRLGGLIYKKEVTIRSLLKKFARPKFNIVPGRKWHLASCSRDVSTSPILSQVLKQTHNYIDPALYMLVKHPNNKKFIYYYGGRSIPEITEIPCNLSKSAWQQFIFDTCKSKGCIKKENDATKRRKIKILLNKILNLKHQVGENRNLHAELDIKKEASCAVSFISLPDSSNAILKTELESRQESNDKTNLTMLETELLNDARQADLTLQKHIKCLQDFDICTPFVKREQTREFEKGSNTFNGINNNNVQTSLTPKFSYEVENSCELPSSKEVNYILGGIRNLKNATDTSEVEASEAQCRFRILSSSSDDLDSKENGDDMITLKCFWESPKHGEFNESYSKEICSSSAKVFGDIAKTNSHHMYSFESLQLSNKYNFRMRRFQNYREPNDIDSSSDESDSNYVAFTEDVNNIYSSTFIENATSSRIIKSERIPAACNSRLLDNPTKVERNLDTPSADSDYTSVSTISSGRKTSNEHEISPSNHSVSSDSLMTSKKLLKSPKFSPRINIISDVLLRRPSHVRCSKRSASTGSREISFENGEGNVSIEVSDIVEEYKLKPKWDHTYAHPYLSEAISKRRRSTPSIYINCDGAMDSSSEDEETMKTKGKKYKKPCRGISQYAPLPISVSKSPRIQGNCLEAEFADNTVGKPGDRSDFQLKSSAAHQKAMSKSCISFKRKLHFEGEVTLNNTTTADFLSCAYSPKSVTKHSISTLRNTITLKLPDTSDASPQTVNADKDFDENSNNSQSVSDASPRLQTTNSDSDLFSEDEDVNRSFFKSYDLSVSEQYDRQTKYKAQEGCSTVFTPCSIITQDTVLSWKNSGSQMFSDSTSVDITPYQEVDVKTTTQGVIFKENNQTSSESSDIVPYQNFKELGMKKPQVELCSSTNVIVLKPAFFAPTRSQVEASLNELKIAQVNVEEPFYGNVEDYTGVVEVGHNTLRIPSKTTSHLQEFLSDFGGIMEYRKRYTEMVANLIWNSNNLKSLKLSHCNNRDVIIRPIAKPPSRKDVLEWIADNSKENKVILTPDDKSINTKIYIPNSPGHDLEDLELSLSVTPCTPLSQAKQVQSSEPETPKSSHTSQSLSPILDHRKKKCKRKNFDSSKPFSLRESVLHSDETNISCQITGISQNNSFGFNKSVQNLQAARVALEHQHLTTMVMELHIRTRGDFKPDPEYDAICAIFYSILNDVPEGHAKKPKSKGVVALNCLPGDLGKPNENFLSGIGIDCDITYAETEEALITTFLSLIKYWDPDVFAGYEIQMLSWGYLIDRSFVLSINIIPLLGRSQINKYGGPKQKTSNYEIETVITGRIVLDVWRIMRHEIALQSYTFESIVYHILHKRVPMYAFKDLNFWWDHRTNLYRHRVVSYYLLRVDTVLELFDKLDFLNRTSELARLFGIMFYEVLSRGSQFRVESMMLRLAKPFNYIPVSPSTAQRAKMKAPEYIALVMEPESKLYNDPVIVLDFQSLYPSIIIAYNYCFTTCLGRVSCLGTNNQFEFGASQLKVPRKIVEKLSKRNLLNFSPCGIAYVKQKVRQGILPKMLTEILDTRLMVKNSMKENKGNENLQKVLHNRQLGLKLIANVTYGYTAANFSGRMCCVEVGDSVVSKARETLQRAIALVESTTEWGARVVYGDTDSLFVLVPGKTKEAAFEVGKKIADAITADNPDPVKLKLEKVYQPCILQTKKRYVGYMYESPDQKEPVYDAKGIETVRRDGCPAVAKMLQKCLTLLFETKDVSLVKKYILRQFNKIQAGRASIQDLTFAKEYRGASGYKPGACVPALELARKWIGIDRRSEPRSGERVPYIIVNGPPGLPLIRLVRSPRDLLNDNSLRPNSLYYITKVIIPPINRCFNLIGADLHTWYNQMPRKYTQYLPNSSPIVKSTISQYFVSKICASCSQPTQNGLCDRCCQNVNVTAFTLTEKLRKWEENFHNTKLICHSCTGHLDEITCISLDCPVLYRRNQTHNDLQQSTYVRELLVATDIFSENSFFED